MGLQRDRIRRLCLAMAVLAVGSVGGPRTGAGYGSADGDRAPLRPTVPLGSASPVRRSPKASAYSCPDRPLLLERCPVRRLPSVILEGDSPIFASGKIGQSPHDPLGATGRIFGDCQIGFLARGYYLDDQRVRFTGLEDTFGAEAVLAPLIKRCWAGWETILEGEFYFNQPFDRNILVDTQERVSYAGNFQVDTFEISKLLVAFRRNNLLLAIGKMETPFGRTYFPLFSNARLDAPFIRTESILWRETGALVHYAPGWLVADVAIANGSEDRDTNSSKGLIGRLGIQRPGWAAGLSLKVQDGIGSEGQKTFNNHLGADFMVRRGRFILSGEVIYDEYGFRRPGFNPDRITWGRSIYYRDQNYRLNVPITGLGYYVDLGIQGDRWATTLNYGEFYPQKLGDPRHDVPNRRGLVKFAYAVTPYAEMFSVVVMETEGYVAQAGQPRSGVVVLAGFQCFL